MLTFVAVQVCLQLAELQRGEPLQDAFVVSVLNAVLHFSHSTQCQGCEQDPVISLCRLEALLVQLNLTNEIADLLLLCREQKAVEGALPPTRARVKASFEHVQGSFAPIDLADYRSDVWQVLSPGSVQFLQGQECLTQAGELTADLESCLRRILHARAVLVDLEADADEVGGETYEAGHPSSYREWIAHGVDSYAEWTKVFAWRDAADRPETVADYCVLPSHQSCPVAVPKGATQSTTHMQESSVQEAVKMLYHEAK